MADFRLLYVAPNSKFLPEINKSFAHKNMSPAVSHLKINDISIISRLQEFDIIAIHYAVSHSKLLAFVQTIKQSYPSLAIILICKDYQEANSIEVLDLYVNDIITEDLLFRLPFITQRELKITELAGKENSFLSLTKNLNLDIRKLSIFKQTRLQTIESKLSEILKKKKLIEQDLLKSESMFKIFHELSLEGLGILTAIRDSKGFVYDYRIDYVNPSAAKMMMRPSEEIINSTVLNFFKSGIAASIIKDFNNVIATAKPCDVEYKINFEGSIYWIRNLAVKMQDGIAVTFSDITKRKISEVDKDKLIKSEKGALAIAETVNSMLAKSKEEYRIMGETIPYGIWKLNAKGTPLYASQSFLDLLDITLTQAGEFGWLRRIHPLDLFPMLRKWLTCQKTGNNWEDEYRIIDKKGIEHYILSKGLPVKNKSGKIESWVGINLDISNRVEMENQIKESSAKNNEIMNRISDAFFALDKDWRITYLNYHSKEFNNLNEAHLGKIFWEVFPELIDTIYYKNYHKAMDEQVSFSFEAIGLNIEKWYLVSVYPSYDGITIYAKDITETKQASDILKITLQEKEVLLREVHHRVKNNLQIITSMISLQTSYLDDPVLIERFIDTNNRIKSMSIVHEQLYKSDKLNSINFRKHIYDLTNALTISSKVPGTLIDMHIECPETELGLDDSINLGLIINEILLNSFKHAFKYKKYGVISLCIKEENEFIFLDISDDGDGISKNVDINDTGTFGMQLIFALIAQMNGNVTINSNNGTQFLIKVKKKTK